MLYTFFLLVGSLHAASVAAQNCNAPQYAFVADYLDDYQPAVRYCTSRFGAPTSTITVTSTVTRVQKRAEATLSVDIHAVISKPKPGSDLAIANANTNSNLRRPSSAKDRRQSGWSSFLSSYWFNQLSKNSQAQSWVQGICSCIVDPVTTTATQVVTKTSTRAASSSTFGLPRPSSPSVPAVPSASSTWKSSALSIPTSTSISTSSLWKSSTLSTATRSSAPAGLPSSAPANLPSGNAPPSGFPGGNNPPPSGGPGGPGAPPSSAIQSLTSSAAAAAPTSVLQSLTSAAAAPPTSVLQSLSSALSSALPTTTTTTTPAAPLSPALQSSNCATGPYNGTGACDCAYTVFCGYSGNCGAANETSVTAVASWQACGQACDNDSACAAWSYSYATGLCTEVVDPDCDTEAFDTVRDPNAVLGVYEGACQGVCLS